jgi:hypothetical protein
MTEEFFAKRYSQVEPQLIPDGLLVTVPEPDPILETERVYFSSKMQSKFESQIYPVSQLSSLGITPEGVHSPHSPISSVL